MSKTNRSALGDPAPCVIRALVVALGFSCASLVEGFGYSVSGRAGAIQLSRSHRAYLPLNPAPVPRCNARSKAAKRAERKGVIVASSGTGMGGAVTRRQVVVEFLAGATSVCAAIASLPRGEAEALGVVDDLFDDCPATPTCVSSQDDRPYPFMEPWAYDTTTEVAMDRLRTFVELTKGAQIKMATPRYLRAEYEVRSSLPPTVDEVEFYFTPGDDLVQFRASRREGPTDFGANRRRMDGIRMALHFESIPVLRNRRRTLVFGESPLDTFGPSLNPSLDPSVVQGDTDPMSPAFETPSKELLRRTGKRSSWWGEAQSRAGGYHEWRPPGGGVGSGGIGGDLWG
ncbi:unnamed protein product [Discosporangium mesarthrocarpum]